LFVWFLIGARWEGERIDFWQGLGWMVMHLVAWPVLLLIFVLTLLWPLDE
jgi:hypothetical protein